MGGQHFAYVWKRCRVAASEEPITAAALAHAEEMGWTLFHVPSCEATEFPEELADALTS